MIFLVVVLKARYSPDTKKIGTSDFRDNQLIKKPIIDLILISNITMYGKVILFAEITEAGQSILL